MDEQDLDIKVQANVGGSDKHPYANIEVGAWIPNRFEKDGKPLPGFDFGLTATVYVNTAWHEETEGTTVEVNVGGTGSQPAAWYRKKHAVISVALEIAEFIESRIESGDPVSVAVAAAVEGREV